MKKVWIASIFACILLMVPFTNVIGASEVEEDCNCNPTISDSQLVRIERLLDRLESRINFILLRYGHIPEVKEKCEEILELFNFDELWRLIICTIIHSILLLFTYFFLLFPEEFWLPSLILAPIWGPLYLVYIFLLCVDFFPQTSISNL